VPHHLLQVRVAWPGKGCHSVGKGVFELPKRHSAPPRAAPACARDGAGARFLHILVDFVGPLPALQGATYMFMVIDWNTRWFEALPLSDISAKSWAAVLTQGWIARYSVSAVITSDRGSQFTSPLGQPLQHPGHLARADHRLPPAVQRLGGALPPMPCIFEIYTKRGIF
jgi:hypothetical protein